VTHEDLTVNGEIVEPRAVLLLGPTGSGKSPLGDHLARHGWRGRRCLHFDFGVHLRAVASGGATGFDADEIAFVQGVLRAGALLENETFFIAGKILEAFLETQDARSRDVLLLNGLPRHVGQAEAVDRILAIDPLLYLDCTPEVVHRRLRLNSGGDRTARVDDDVALVAEKLRIFAERTAPLVAHYRGRGAEVHRRPVGVATRPGDLLAGLR